MRFFTTIVVSALSVNAAVAVPLQARGIQIGALNIILATMNSTLVQDQAIAGMFYTYIYSYLLTHLSDQVIATMKTATASEVSLALQMAAIMSQTGSDIASSDSQIASTLANTGTTLAYPDVIFFTQALQQGATLVKSSMATFQAQASAAVSAFSSATIATIEAENLAAEAALQSFFVPMIAYAKNIQTDGTAQSVAGLANLQSAAAGCVVLEFFLS